MTKYLFVILTLLVVQKISAEPLSYFTQFFERKVDITHDPDFPQSAISSAYNDPYEVIQEGTHKAKGSFLQFRLKEDGSYSFWYFPVKHRWKNGQRQIRLGKCHAKNGKWMHIDGSLHLDNYIRLDAAYKDGKNFLTATFLDLKVDESIQALENYISMTSKNSFGDILSSDGDYSCKGFWLPLWLPIPNTGE